MDPVSETPGAIDFRRFRVLPHRRELLAKGRPVQLGGRAFDVLMALIEASGAVVDKNTSLRLSVRQKLPTHSLSFYRLSASKRLHIVERILRN
jgi:DNA-binding response OmpR family regulator